MKLLILLNNWPNFYDMRYLCVLVFLEWNGNDFLWGVFHRVKTADARCKDIEEVILSGCPSIGADESDYVDMEIDMLGGSNVGKVDVVISKEPIRENSESCIVETATRQSSSFNVAEKICRDIPPDFENCISSSLGTQKCKYSVSPGQLDKRDKVMNIEFIFRYGIHYT